QRQGSRTEITGIFDPTGFGEGQRYLGTAAVTTDDAGSASFDVFLDTKINSDEVIAATATNPEGNTSEFSFALGGHATAAVRDGLLLIQGHDADIRVAQGASGPDSFQVTEGNRTESFAGVTHGIRMDLDGRQSAIFFDGMLSSLAVPGSMDVHARN